MPVGPMCFLDKCCPLRLMLARKMDKQTPVKQLERLETLTLGLQSYLLRRCLEWVPEGSRHTF